MKNIFHGKNGEVLVFDVGATAVKVGYFNDSGVLLVQKRLDTPKNYNDFLELLKTEIDHFKVFDVAIGVPGVIWYEKKLVTYSPNIVYLNNKRLVEDLLKVFPSLKIVMENDANLAVLGEYMAVCKDCKNIVLVTLGTGVGGGVIVNGELFRTAISAFEIGHMKIMADGMICGCGKRGCFEAYCSKSGFEKIYADISGHMGSSISEIMKKAVSGDKIARIATNIYGKYLGIGLSNIANIMTPEIIVIGGGISELSEHFFKQTVRVFSKNIFEGYKDRIKLSVSELKNSVALYGGYFLLKRSLS